MNYVSVIMAAVRKITKTPGFQAGKLNLWNSTAVRSILLLSISGSCVLLYQNCAEHSETSVRDISSVKLATLSVNSIHITEGKSGTLTISLDQVPQADITVTWELLANANVLSHFPEKSGTEVMLAGTQSVKIIVSTVEDTNIEEDQNVQVFVRSNHPMAAEGYGTIVLVDSTVPLPSPANEWVLGEWGPCTRTGTANCDGMRTRSVTCPTNACYSEQPDTTEACVIDTVKEFLPGTLTLGRGQYVETCNTRMMLTSSGDFKLMDIKNVSYHWAYTDSRYCSAGSLNEPCQLQYTAIGNLIEYERPATPETSFRIFALDKVASAWRGSSAKLILSDNDPYLKVIDSAGNTIWQVCGGTWDIPDPTFKCYQYDTKTNRTRICTTYTACTTSTSCVGPYDWGGWARGKKRLLHRRRV